MTLAVGGMLNRKLSRMFLSGLYLKVGNFFFLNQNICCGYSKEPSQWDGSFQHPKHMFKPKGKKILTIVRSKILFILTYESGPI